MKRYTQQGAAIILAMLVVALATTTAVFMAWQQSMWTQHVGNLTARSQANALARGAIDWTRGVLAEDARKGNVDHLGEDWARRLVALPVDAATIGGAIVDQQALFNLNNLLHNGRDSMPDIDIFRRLLEHLKLPPDLTNAVLDWIDEDSALHSPGGAEDADYLLGNQPYRAANRLLLNIDELYRVRGFNPQIIERLRPFVTALPERTAINVNTAPREILLALLPELSETDMSLLLERRRNIYFNDKHNFRVRLPRPAPALRDEDFDFKSGYFLASVQVRTDHADTAYAVLLARSAGGGWPGIVWQQQLTD